MRTVSISLTRLSAAGVVALLLLRPLGAQPVVTANAFPSPDPPSLVIPLLPQDAAQGQKDGGAALLLAIPPCVFGVCGLGSFYAGDSGHGWRHLAIGVASIVVAAAAVSSCDILWSDDDCENEGIVFTAAALGYLGNLVWSAVVANQDVKAWNRRGG